MSIYDSLQAFVLLYFGGVGGSLGYTSLVLMDRRQAFRECYNTRVVFIHALSLNRMCIMACLTLSCALRVNM